MKRKWKKAIIVIALICVILTPIVHGPARYKTLGYRKFATIEFVKRSPLVLKPFSALAGIVVDIAITPIEIPAILVCAVHPAWTRGPDGTLDKNVTTLQRMFIFPIWYPMMIYGVNNVAGKDFYKEEFGREGIYQ
jgi:hypothetical protein